jgi:hypothetical protein
MIMPIHEDNEVADFDVLYKALPAGFIIKLHEELAAQGRHESTYAFLDRTMPDEVRSAILDELQASWEVLGGGATLIEERANDICFHAKIEISLMLLAWSRRVAGEAGQLLNAAVTETP